MGISSLWQALCLNTRPTELFWPVVSSNLVWKLTLFRALVSPTTVFFVCYRKTILSDPVSVSDRYELLVKYELKLSTCPDYYFKLAQHMVNRKCSVRFYFVCKVLVRYHFASVPHKPIDNILIRQTEVLWSAGWQLRAKNLTRWGLNWVGRMDSKSPDKFCWSNSEQCWPTLWTELVPWMPCRKENFHPRGL